MVRQGGANVDARAAVPFLTGAGSAIGERVALWAPGGMGILPMFSCLRPFSENRNITGWRPVPQPTTRPAHYRANVLVGVEGSAYNARPAWPGSREAAERREVSGERDRSGHDLDLLR